MQSESAVPAADKPMPVRSGPVVLGLFILAQLAFLVVANLLSVIERGHDSGKEHIAPPLRPLVEQATPDTPGEDHFWTTLASINRLADIWSHITGQPQGWSLFANPDNVCDFPAIQFRWDDPSELYAIARANEPELMLSDNEPADIDGFVRWGKFRLRRLEGNVLPGLEEKETPEETIAYWSAEMPRYVERYQSLILAYLRLRLHQWESSGGQPRPTQVILLQRRYLVRPPHDAAGNAIWQGPRTTPLARWRPQETGPIEWYDSVSQRFRPTSK